MKIHLNIIVFVLLGFSLSIFSSDQKGKLVGIAAAREEVLERGDLKESASNDAALMSDFQKVVLITDAVAHEIGVVDMVVSTTTEIVVPWAQQAAGFVAPMIAKVAPVAVNSALGSASGGIASVLGSPIFVGGCAAYYRYHS